MQRSRKSFLRSHPIAYLSVFPSMTRATSLCWRRFSPNSIAWRDIISLVPWGEWTVCQNSTVLFCQIVKCELMDIEMWIPSLKMHSNIWNFVIVFKNRIVYMYLCYRPIGHIKYEFIIVFLKLCSCQFSNSTLIYKTRQRWESMSFVALFTPLEA